MAKARLPSRFLTRERTTVWLNAMGEVSMHSRTPKGIGEMLRSYPRRNGRTRVEAEAEYPTPSQIALRIAAALLVALCVAIAASALAGAMTV